MDSLNFEELGIDWDPRKVGSPQYDQRIMLKLLVYVYSYGIRSSRKLERETHYNLSFIWLTGGLKLDHKTIAEFRRRNKKALSKVLKQCARLCIDLDLNWYEWMLTTIKSEVEDIWLHSLSPAEILWLANRSNLSLSQTLERLRIAGLDSLPGGGAEILVDQVRQRVRPAKLTTSEWFEVMETAQSIGMSTTATMVYGLGETTAQRIEHLLRVRELQDRTNGFRAFIPWSFQSNNTQLSHPPLSGVDYLRMVAISRLVLDNIKHIQAGWVTEAPYMAQLALTFGVDDFGGVLMEESVVKATGIDFGVTVEQIISLISETSMVPAQRNTEYKILRTFEPEKSSRGSDKECYEQKESYSRV